MASKSVPPPPGDGGEMIDLSGMLVADVTASGSFDLRQIEATTVGKLLQVLPIATLLIDETLHVVFANQACERLGWSVESLRDAELFSLFPEVSTAQEVGDVVREVFVSRTTQTKEATWEADKKRRWGRLTLRPVRMRAERLVLLMVKDVTAEREQAQLLTTVLAASPVGVGLSIDRRMVWGNDALVTMFGFTEEEEYLGKSLRMLYPSDEEFQRVGAAIHEGLSSGETNTIDAKMRKKDGSVFDVTIRLRPVDPSDPSKGHVAAVTDVTERKKAENDRKESEEKFRLFMDNSPYIAWMKDEQGRYVYLSNTFEKRYGLKAEDRLGKTDAEIWPHELARQFRESDEAVLSTGKAMDFTAETLIPNGERRYWWDFKFPFKDPSGRRYVGGIGVDITAQRLAEQALTESEARFREFAEALSQVVYELDAQGNIIFVNHAGLALGGYGPEDLEKGITMKDLLAPEDWERLFENIHKVAQGESTSGAEYTLLMKDGTRVPIAAYSTPITRENKIVGLRGVCVDIRRLKEAEEVLKRSREDVEKLVAERTADLEMVNEQLRQEIDRRIRMEEELAHSEARFRGIFETAPDCVFIKDLSLRYTFVNPAKATLMEMPQSAILGKVDKELFGSAAAEHLSSVDSRVLRGDVVEEEHTLEVRGSHLIFLSIKAPLTDSQGQIVGICGISRDVTERRSFVSFGTPVKFKYTSAPMRAAVSAAQLAATTGSTVLLTGESGSGKDYLARYIHERSERSTGPFYAINCASIPTELAESELFGHEAGAFTGASKRKKGLLELAEGGTILLNEIGELPLDIQAKLLAFLDTRSFTRVGGEKTVTVNVRLIAATNRDLTKEISEGRFRKDLFYRLDVFAIGVPPLRERLEDLSVLAAEQLSKLVSAFGSARPVHLGSGVIELLTHYGWPGNVRELRNVLERALILSRGGPLRPEHFQFGRALVQTMLPPASVSEQRPLPDVLSDIERSLIEDALHRSGGNKTDAADLLGISRFALTRHMRKLGLS